MMTPIVSKIDSPKIDQLVKNLPQALLLIGEEGLDVESVSRYLSQHTPSDTFILTTLKDKTQIGVPQIRELISKMYTYATKRRIIIIRGGHLLTESAQNALLKILEEPTDKLHFIIETSSPEKILPTISSRCQTLQLHRTSPDQDKAILSQVTTSAERKRQILFLAAGRPKLLLDLSANDDLFESYRTMATDAKIILSKPGSYEALKAVIDYAESRETALKFIDILLSLIKFQMKSPQTSTGLTGLLDNIYKTEAALLGNGHIKLAMLNIVL